MSFRTKDSERRAPLKKGIDAEETRRRREDLSVQLRKDKRDENLQKKRLVKGGSPTQLDSLDHAALASAEARTAQLRMEIAERLRQLPQLVEAVHSHDPQRQLEAVIAFRKLLSIERNPPIDDVIASGVVPRLVQFLMAAENPPLQFEAAWALTNVASGTTKHTQKVIECGAVDIFVMLLSSPNEDVREQAVWALGNIAGDSCVCRDLVLQKGALQPLLKLCDVAGRLTMLKNATWTLSNFCRGKPQPNFDLVSPALPVLAHIINNSEDAEVLTDACWALSYLSDDTGPSNTKIQAVIQAGVTRKLVQLLMHNSPNVKTPALRTVGNIVTGDDQQTQEILRMSALPCLKALLDNPKKGIRKESWYANTHKNSIAAAAPYWPALLTLHPCTTVCFPRSWTISNITAGNTLQIQQVIDAGILPPLISILEREDFDIRKEAAWAISNATSGGDASQIRRMVEDGVIRPLCDLLDSADPKIIMVAIEGIENILRVGKQDAATQGGDNRYAQMVEADKGLEKLEKLQEHENDDIYEKAMAVLKQYWDVGEEQEAVPAIVPQQAAGGFQFGAFPQQQGHPDQQQQFKF